MRVLFFVFMALFPKISVLGDANERAVKKLAPLVEQVNAHEEATKKLSDEELKNKTVVLKERLTKGASLDDVLPEAFAAVREAARRTLGQRAFNAQLMGGMVLHRGSIAQMRTGEGKTLAATAPVYLNALSGEGAHVVTVNDYLSSRDAVWMGQIYYALGLSIGAVTHDAAFVYDPAYKGEKKDDEDSPRDEERDETGSFRIEESYLRPVARKEAYAADITYGTNNEFGFDYLRDNLVQSSEQKVQRGFHYAIVDEVDSILIDEARTPLIISAPDVESTDLYKTFAGIVPQLKEETDYTVDRKMHSVSITEKGISKVERILNIENIYDSEAGGGIRYVHNLEQALRAQVLFERDKDYVVKDDGVIIVDEFTGRLMPGRRYSEGLHQAIEAKEGATVQRESRTVASITFQNYFRMYDKLAGMTGTAITNAEEFDKVYGLQVVVVPTNKPLVRDDMRDLVFRTENGKFTALAREVKARHEKGQPVLIGTTSIERNEYLHAILQKEGIAHEVLNAKNHQREGEIIAQAGRPGAVTIATNMAGRGVDIILGGNPPDKETAQRVREAGGLHVIGTERHEARRIDDQLRGRAGRQGDPGSSQFYLSLEDKLMKVFGGDRMQKLMATLKVPEDEPLESKIVSGAIEGAQSKIEGMNFDTRKHLLDYDEVLNKQRQTVYNQRDRVLEANKEEMVSIGEEYLVNHGARIVAAHMGQVPPAEWNVDELFKEVQTIAPFDTALRGTLEKLADEEDAEEKVAAAVEKAVQGAYEQRISELGEEAFSGVVRWALLRTTDMLWMDHLDMMEHMRSSVRLSAYAQRDPLVEYKNEGVKMFRQLLAGIESAVATTVLKVHVHKQGEGHPPLGLGNLQLKHEGAATSGSDSEVHNQGAAQDDSTPRNEPGRNDPCYCGSGKKYKKCHGK
jgi:preprotein translocase subunit SecA